jgi:hypothetical protein
LNLEVRNEAPRRHPPPRGVFLFPGLTAKDAKSAKEIQGELNRDGMKSTTEKRASPSLFALYFFAPSRLCVRLSK